MNNVQKEKAVREPLFHIEKRDMTTLPWWKSWVIRAIAIFAALIFCGILCVFLIKKNPFEIYKTMFTGPFMDATGKISERRIWNLLKDTAIILGFSLAVVPAFKMRFWNLGANGQALMGCLATTMCMYFLGGKMPDGVVNLIMLASSVAIGIIWAVIPAIFKAKWNTNESLFTLMMNYIATGIVSAVLTALSRSGNIGQLPSGRLPVLGEKAVLPILVVVLLTAFMYVYLRFSKHGYEISVVGESENTARYIGVNIKKVVIRTLILSGAICGIMGLLISGAIDYSIFVNAGETSVYDYGFTAILVAWLAKFNPLAMVIVSFFYVFLTHGTDRVRSVERLGSVAFSDIIIGIIFFFIIGCEFFINYKIRGGERVRKFFDKVKNFYGKIKRGIKALFVKSNKKELKENDAQERVLNEEEKEE